MNIAQRLAHAQYTPKFMYYMNITKLPHPCGTSVQLQNEY